MYGKEGKKEGNGRERGREGGREAEREGGYPNGPQPATLHPGKILESTVQVT